MVLKVWRLVRSEPLILVDPVLKFSSGPKQAELSVKPLAFETPDPVEPKYARELMKIQVIRFSKVMFASRGGNEQVTDGTIFEAPLKVRISLQILSVANLLSFVNQRTPGRREGMKGLKYLLS